MSGNLKATLITHPLRARILTALMGRRLTAGQIAALLPDIPLVSVYRHIRTLLEGGALRVADTVRVKGAATKVYETVPEMGMLTAQDVGTAEKAEQLRYFTTFLETLAHSYRLSLERDMLDPSQSEITVRMTHLELTREQARAFVRELGRLVESFKQHATGDEEGARYLFSVLLFPDQPEPPRE